MKNIKIAVILAALVFMVGLMSCTVTDNNGASSSMGDNVSVSEDNKTSEPSNEITESIGTDTEPTDPCESTGEEEKPSDSSSEETQEPELTEAHVHFPDDSWDFDSENHWQTCSCGEKMNAANHSGGTATPTSKAKCEVCGAEYGELAETTGKQLDDSNLGEWD